MPFISHAQNLEDVLLWRALGNISAGFYIDVGAWDPDRDSVTRAFYDVGWNGINIEPIPNLLNVFVSRRPRDINLAIAVAAEHSLISLTVVNGTGLSTTKQDIASIHKAAGFSTDELNVPAWTLAEICRAHAASVIHFLKIDCEGSEREALLGADFGSFRPWIVLVEATKPNSPEPNHDEWDHLLLTASYRFVWFDGLNRFYVAAEQYDALARHFLTPPNIFDNYLRVCERSGQFQIPALQPSLAAVTPRMLSEEQRINLAVRCRDADSIPKVPQAGSIIVQDDGTRLQIMHNGLRVLADGYYGAWMTQLIASCHGHHEPQEERCFHEVLQHIPADSYMIELGGFWAYYTAWFLRDQPLRRAIVVEPDPAHRVIGEKNLALNGLSADFVAGLAGSNPLSKVPFRTEESGVLELPRVSVEQLMQLHEINQLQILHCDIQGAELDVLEGCRTLFAKGAIHWVFVSTHAHLISGDPLTHQRCLALLAECGADIIVEHDVYESFSGDGLIVAHFHSKPTSWKPITVSRARYGESLFRNPSFDLAESREWDPRRDLIGNTVQALYRTLLLREPDDAGLWNWIDYLTRTNDPGQAMSLMLESQEFTDRKQHFVARYFGQKFKQTSDRTTNNLIE